MRITYVVHQFLPDYFTGTEQYTFAIAKAMQERGHDVEVFALDPDFSDQEPVWNERREVVEGIPVLRFRYWYSLGADFAQLEYYHPYAGHRFRSYLEERQPDLVHAFHLRHVGANLLDEATSLGIKTVVHLMDFWFLCAAVTLSRRDGSLCEGPPELGYGCIDCVAPDLQRELDAAGLTESVRVTAARERNAALTAPSNPSPESRAQTITARPHYLRKQLARVDAVFAPSKFLREMFIRNGQDPASIEVCSYGVDPQRVGDARSRRGTRSADAPLRIGYFGSIAPHKGVDLLIDAVLATEGALHCAVYGRTSDFPDFAEPLRERASADPRIEFRAPFERDSLEDALSAIDVLVVPSRWYENTPFVVLEAFCGGVPVIATNLGGISEIIEDGAWGDLFELDDSADLSAKIQRLIQEPERLARYVDALPAVKTIAVNADEIETRYGQLTEGRA